MRLLLTLIAFSLTASPAFAQGLLSARMRVLTPHGYIRLRELKPGDEVMSWDFRRGQLVLNAIYEITKVPAVELGRLSRLKAGPHGLEASDQTQLFHSPSASRYRQLQFLNATDPVLRLNGCDAALIARGPYHPSATRTQGMNLTLLDPPNNCIVEGIVVRTPP